MQKRQVFRNWKLCHHIVGNLDSPQQAAAFTWANRLHLDPPHHLVYSEDF
jgi:hypothetical protein